MNLDTTLDQFDKLDVESQDIIIELLNKHRIENRRDQIYNNYKIALDDFEKGKLIPETSDEFFKRSLFCKLWI